MDQEAYFKGQSTPLSPISSILKESRTPQITYIIEKIM